MVARSTLWGVAITLSCWFAVRLVLLIPSVREMLLR
jgi:hypothetical protein